MTPLSVRSRALTAVAALFLLALFFVPLWRIELQAPQYPEGLGMLIRVNTITGLAPTDLHNINGLNHYIGMKAIEPDSIPVLHYMPWAVGALALFGLLTALVGRRALLFAWLGSFGLAGAAGLAEFYAWSYDYGHHLAADAAIKVPGMTYQPPFIGSKQMLNITASSWPAMGGWLAAAAFVLAVLALRPFRHRVRVAAAPLPAAAPLAVALPIALVILGLLAGAPSLAVAQTAVEVVVTPAGPVRSIASALRLVRSGGRVVVMAGRYHEQDIVIDRPVELIGRDLPLIDGDGEHGIITIKADDVTVRGLRLAHVATSYVEDRAAIRVENARRCALLDNQVDDAFFGIYLANVTDCRIERNTLQASHKTETSSGNGIHLWTTRNAVIADNTVHGFRDGIYFEFVHDTHVRRNTSEGNLRYGLHFMYSDDCEYVRNTFRRNGAGVAVMYTHRVQMIGNRFEHNWGAATYGLLLKEISDARLEHNLFYRNTTALVADGANRLVADRNDFIENGWAVKLDASTVDGALTRNNFIANTFDMASNSRDPSTVVAGNYWDAYRGYDLDRNGVGDVPFRPVRLFSMIVEHHAPALILLRSGFVELLDAAERVLPALTPATLADARPAMRRLP
ncbi:MAG: nitrous oxide reductase family maturation protein NosD [bacterium]